MDGFQFVFGNKRCWSDRSLGLRKGGLLSYGTPDPAWLAFSTAIVGHRRNLYPIIGLASEKHGISLASTPPVSSVELVVFDEDSKEDIHVSKYQSGRWPQKPRR